MLPQISWARKAAVLAAAALASVLLAVFPGGSAARPAVSSPDYLAARAGIPARLHAALARHQARRPRETASAASQALASAAPLPLGDPAGTTALSAAQVGAVWIAAGGSPAAQATAECIAWYESGDVPAGGLWRAGDRSSSPSASARAAVALSRAGADWSGFPDSSRCAG